MTRPANGTKSNGWFGEELMWPEEGKLIPALWIVQVEAFLLWRPMLIQAPFMCVCA